MCIPAQTVLSFVSKAINPQERPQILAADRAAVKLLNAVSAVSAFSLDGDNNDKYDAFETLARSLNGATMSDAEYHLERIDQVLHSQADNESATDEACARWTPIVDAAYRIGLSLGLRLAGNSIPALTSAGKKSINLDDALDRELSSVLTAAIASASSAERLTLLTLLETPNALAATEGLLSAVLRGAQ